MRFVQKEIDKLYFYLSSVTFPVIFNPFRCKIAANYIVYNHVFRKRQKLFQVVIIVFERNHVIVALVFLLTPTSFNAKFSHM